MKKQANVVKDVNNFRSGGFKMAANVAPIMGSQCTCVSLRCKISTPTYSAQTRRCLGATTYRRGAPAARSTARTAAGAAPPQLRLWRPPRRRRSRLTCEDVEKQIKVKQSHTIPSLKLVHVYLNLFSHLNAHIAFRLHEHYLLIMLCSCLYHSKR